MRRLLRILRWIGIGVTIAIGTASLLLLITYSLLQSDSGRERIVQILNSSLSTPGATEVRIGRLEGNLLESFEIHDLSVADGDGSWLRLKFVAANWRAGDLLNRKLSISNLDIDGLTVLRQPIQAESTGEFNWPLLPLGLSIERFSLSDAVLEHPVIGEEVKFKASGDTEIEGADRVRTTINITRTDGISATARLQAMLQPRSKFLRFELAFDEARGGLLARLLDLGDLPSLSIQAAGEGPLDQLRGNARVGAGDLAFVEAAFTISVGNTPALELKGRTQISRFIEEPLRQLLASDIAFDLQGELRDDAILLQRGRFANDLTRIEVTGSLRDFAADFNVSMDVDDLAPLSDLAGIALRGQASMKTRFQSEDYRRGVTTTSRAVFSEMLPAASPWNTLTGPKMNLAGKIEFDFERHWQFSDLILTGDAVELSTSGSIVGDPARLDINYQLTLPRLDALSHIVGKPVAGKLTIMGNISGSLAAPTLTANMLSPDLSVAGILPGAAEGRVSIPQLTDTINGDIELSIANQRFGTFNLASKFSTNASDSLRLDGLKLESRNTKLAGAMTFDLSKATVVGKITGKRLALAPWSDLAGLALSGNASLSLDLSSSGKNQQLDLAVNTRGLGIELDPQQSLQVDSIKASARIEDLFGTPRGGMRLLATDARISDTQLASVVFETRMIDLDHLQGRLQVQGDFHGPFELETSADYSARNRGFVLTVSEADASVSGQTFKLSKSALLEHDNGTTVLSELSLLVADGSLTINGAVDTDHIKASLEAKGISIAALRSVIPTENLTGVLSGNVRVSGSRVAPTGELNLNVVDVLSAHSQLSGAAPVLGDLHGEWRDGRLQLSAKFSGVTETSLDLLASAPLRIDPETLMPTMPMNEAIDGKLSWSGDLGPVWNLLSPNEDRFTGPGEIALALEGSIDNPQIGGYFQVSGGRYENLQYATSLVDVDLRLSGDGDKLVLEKLSAGDGNTGSLTGSGFIDFIPALSYPIHLSLEFGDMLLVALDNVTLNASGNLALEGNIADAMLSGKIVAGQSELNLAGTLPPSVVELDVEEINLESAEHSRTSPPATTADSSLLDLDLEISIPGRVFVRGLGLESEWMGDMKINGPANTPKVAGVLSPVRGRFFLMGKSFRLESGAIRFTGSDDIDPLLDLTAEYKAASLTALVRVTGTASRPKISLNSRPPLPESEIASQVLFGTNSGNLTTAQSLQLASAIATYSGTGGGIGILDATRRALGVDVINFAESEQNPDKTRVSVGKYIRDGVYLEIEGGGEESSQTSTTIEVEILPNVRFEGGTTETGANKVGVKWKWDY